MTKFSNWTRPLYSDYWPFIIRIVLGGLNVHHGLKKLTGPGGLGSFVQEVAEKGWPLAELQAFIAVFIEFGGGVLLLIGLFTRPVSFLSIGLFTIISFVFLYSTPFPGKEKALLFWLMSIYVFFNGPGKFALDNILFKKNAMQRPA